MVQIAKILSEYVKTIYYNFSYPMDFLAKLSPAQGLEVNLARKRGRGGESSRVGTEL